MIKTFMEKASSLLEHLQKTVVIELKDVAYFFIRS